MGDARRGVTRVAWIVTVLVALLTALLLLLAGYKGYAGLGLAVALSAAINLLLSHSSSARAARPRWLIASFCWSESSAIVRPCIPGRLVGHERRVVAEAAALRGARPRAARRSVPRTRRSLAAGGST